MDKKDAVKVELDDLGSQNEEKDAMLPEGESNQAKRRKQSNEQFNDNLPQDYNFNRRSPPITYDKSWHEAWLEFCTDTSFHGLKQITEPQPYILRRLLWLVLVLLGTGLFLYQMITGIIYYRNYPVSVNVRINHNDSIQFPAITICNQNAFRMSIADEKDWYSLLSHLFLDHHDQNHADDLAKAHNLTAHVTLHEIFETTAHAKEDMIMECRWDSRPCSHKDFVQTFTDYGVCYTFNSGKDGLIKQAIRTGTEGGLQLMLNVEQYEYMVGPNSGAGLRVLIHTQEEAPPVKEFGVAVPPGSQTFLGMTLVKVDNLPLPHGKCIKNYKLKYYDVYSKTNCLKEYLQVLVQDTCECRHINMQDNDEGLYPQCTLEKYFTCVLPTIGKFNDKISEIDCPVPCTIDSYDIFNSIGYISNFDALNMLQSNLTNSLQDKMSHSMEVTQRVNAKIVRDDTYVINSIKDYMDELETSFSNISANIGNIKDELEIVFAKLNKRLNFHLSKGLEKVKYIMEHDFVRGWTILEERTLPFLTVNCFELRFSFRHVTDRVIESMETGDRTLALTQWLNLENRFLERLDVSKRVKANVTEVNEAYKTGKPLIRFQASLKRRYDKSYISVALLQANSSMDWRNNDQDKIYDELFRYHDIFVNSVQTLLDMGWNVTKNLSMDPIALEDTMTQFRNGCIYYNYNVFLYKTRIVDRPVHVINKRIDDFSQANRTLQDAYEYLLRSLDAIKDPLDHIKAGPWKTLSDAMLVAQMYLGNRTVSKYNMSKVLTSKMVTVALQDLHNAFDELRLLERDLQEKLLNTKEAMLDMWYNLFAEYTTRGFYQKVNKDFEKFKDDRDFFYPYFADLLDISVDEVMNIDDDDLEYMMNADLNTMSPTSKLKEIKDFFYSLRDKTDIGERIGSMDENLFNSMNFLRDSLSSFKKRRRVESSFYLTNIIRLDIYMQELSYEEIIQQPAYELLNLLGDIGGSIGLFLGASAMTLAEIFDVLFLQASRLYKR